MAGDAVSSSRVTPEVGRVAGLSESLEELFAALFPCRIRRGGEELVAVECTGV